MPIKHDMFSIIYKPDVLSCLADLSNDEVFTPPDVANQMLDMLPQELFKDPNIKFLDPACKSGVFLREIAKRLIKGLADKIPDLQERCDHIFKEQLYGIAITELTSLLSRRSVYCTKYPNSPFSITKFDDVQGNIVFHKIKHKWDHAGVNGKCIFCGTAYNGDLGNINREGMENHAYEFIHTLHPEEIFNMKFDVIISNPPYQLSDGGNGSSAMPIYNMFVEQAKKLNPKYITMITPSRWFAGGKGLDVYRKAMLSDNRIEKMTDFVNAKDCFPGISIGGGVNYFLWNREYHGTCEYTNIHDGHKSTQIRNMNEFPVFVRYNEALSIIHKVLRKNENVMSNIIGSRNPFGFPSSARGKDEPKLGIRLFSSVGIGYVSINDIKIGNDIVNKYKVMISKVTGEHAGEPDKSGMFRVLSRTEILNPKDICTDSYLIAYSCDSEYEAKNFYSYLCTKFLRFLLLQAVSSINLSKDKFCFIPIQDFSKPWTDEELYKKYSITNDEILFIESMIKPMEIGGDN